MAEQEGMSDWKLKVVTGCGVAIVGAALFAAMTLSPSMASTIRPALGHGTPTTVPAPPTTAPPTTTGTTIPHMHHRGH